MTSNYEINTRTYYPSNKSNLLSMSMNSTGNLENKTDVFFSSMNLKQTYEDHIGEGESSGIANFRDSPDYMDLDIIESPHEKYKNAPYILSR